MPYQPAEHTPQPPSPRSDEEIILESSLESFPASDPPAWVHGKDRPPKDLSSPTEEESRRHSEDIERSMHNASQLTQDATRSFTPPAKSPRTGSSLDHK